MELHGHDVDVIKHTAFSRLPTSTTGADVYNILDVAFFVFFNNGVGIINGGIEKYDRGKENPNRDLESSRHC